MPPFWDMLTFACNFELLKKNYEYIPCHSKADKRFCPKFCVFVKFSALVFKWVIDHLVITQHTPNYSKYTKRLLGSLDLSRIQGKWCPKNYLSAVRDHRNVIFATSNGIRPLSGRRSALKLYIFQIQDKNLT